MPERKIDPKFNIHSSYRKLNIVNPYRYGVAPPTIGSYEPETTAYMNEVGIPNDASTSIYGIPNSQVWSEVDSFVVNLKGYGLLSKSIKIFLKLGNTASQQAIDLITPANVQTFTGSWVHNNTGSVSNGINCYFNTGFIPDLNTASGVGSTVSILSVGSGGNLYPCAMGSKGQSSNSGRFQITPKFDGVMNKIFSYLVGVVALDTPGSSVGTHTITGSTSFGSHYINGSLLIEKTVSGLHSSHVVYEGAANDQNAAGLFFQGTLGVSVYHQGLSATEVSNLNTTINAFEMALNRK